MAIEIVGTGDWGLGRRYAILWHLSETASFGDEMTQVTGSGETASFWGWSLSFRTRPECFEPAYFA